MRIYAIDDEPKMLRMLKDAILKAEPEAEILAFASAADVLKALPNPDKQPDVVFCDIEMPGMNGLTLATKIKKSAPDARIIFVTGYDQYALEAYRIHVHGYLMKPVDAAAIREELDQIPNLPEHRNRRRCMSSALACSKFSGMENRSSSNVAERRNCSLF